MEYEVVRYVENQCPNNQMRDIFFDEVETDDPVQYVKDTLKGRVVEVVSQPGSGGAVTVYASCDGITQRFVFTPV